MQEGVTILIREDHASMKEKNKWMKSKTSSEDKVAINSIPENILSNYLDFDGCYEALSLPFPSSLQDRITTFIKEGFLQK